MSKKPASTKKASKKAAPKSAKKAATKKSTTKKGTPAAAKTVKQPSIDCPDLLVASGACPRGGDHEWTKDDKGSFCSKCLEPKGAAEKAKAKADQAKKNFAKNKPAGDKKMSAIDAAAQVLAKSKEPLSTQQMIAAMAEAKLWTSPGGKTPHATLYSAILREIGAKGKDARFTKTERGRFEINA